MLPPDVPTPPPVPGAPAADPSATRTAPAATGSSASILTGTVSDGSTRLPLAGARVLATASGKTFTATTAADGSYTIALPPGVYDVVATKGGFESAQATGLAIAGGTSTSLPIPMTEAQSGSLRVIGRTSVGASTSINTSASAVSTLNPGEITRRELPTLTNLVAELPGITAARTSGATANAFFIARGGFNETRVNIDGHPLSVGTFGNYNTNYALSTIFQTAQVLEGPGLNGPTAGESAFGTINLQTRDFAPGNYLDVRAGADSYEGSLYSIFGQVNLLEGKLSLLGGRAFDGYRGPSDQYVANRINGGAFGPIAPGIGQAPTFNGLIQWQGDLSDRYSLEGELVKARYRFSNATSLTGEFLGLQGQYVPQGGSYASFYGNEIVAPCYNKAVAAANATQCTTQSQYNAPYAQNLIGQSVPAYSWFPSSYIQNNEPQISAEFRTAIKNDTLLVRPYAALVNRFISGDRENRYPGNNGGFYQVTSSANCQATFSAPTAAANGAKGPCFANDFSGPTGPAYIGASAPSSVVYSTTPNAPACSAAAPCYTTPTGQQNNGKYGFGSTFSQPEVDRLHGTTVQYLHPVANNLFGFSYDYNSDDTFSRSNDTTQVLAGCTETLGSVANTATAAGIGYQPGCGLASTPATSISIPPTIIRKSDFGFTGQLQLNSRLAASIGLYYEAYHANAQTEDPAVLARFANATIASGALPSPAPGGTPNPVSPSNAAPVSLVSRSSTATQFDPHVGLTYKVTPNTIVRASGGSSATFPYASLISGLGSISLPNGANNSSYTTTLANTGLRPETTVAYDLGLDQRLPDTSIFSLDLYDNTVHDTFAAVTTPTAANAAIQAPGGYFISQTINAPIARYYGLQASINKNPALGFGYTFTTTFERAYLDELPRSIYGSSGVPLVNGKQLDGSSTLGAVPYAKAYGEIRYQGLRDSILELGADYQGNNNTTYGPAYTILNATLGFDLAPGFAFATTVDNISNINTGSDLGRALYNQGAITEQDIAVNGQIVGGPGRAKSLQGVDFRTYRFTLQHRF